MYDNTTTAIYEISCHAFAAMGLLCMCLPRSTRSILKCEHCVTITTRLIRDRKTMELEVSNDTASLADVGHLRGQWARAGRLDSVPFMSMSLNTDYHAQRPRDSYNEGPSVVRAIGNSEDGELFYCSCR